MKRRQWQGKCGKSIAQGEQEVFEAVFTEDDVEKYNGLSIHVCARYGKYKLDLEILGKGMNPVSGGLGYKIFNGVCKVRAVLISSYAMI